MAGWTRVSGLSRALGPGAVACVVVGVGACSMAPTQGNATPPQASGGVGGSGVVLAVAGSSTVIELGFGGSESAPCQSPMVPAPVFAPQAFSSFTPARRELYSWTTDAQAAALRMDQTLFVDMSDPALGRGYAFTAIHQIALSAAAQAPDAGPDAGQVPVQAQLAAALSGTLFEKPRYAWPEPWATRMGWPGEDYGGQLLRIVLKPEAWLAIVKGGVISVVDLDNNPVPDADALASPERIGAIFYWRDANSGGPQCGSFFSGGNGYREFIVGNLSMIEEWSIGTQAIRDRLSANIDRLTQFLTNIRSCPVTTDLTTWNESVVCQWDSSLGEPSNDLTSYAHALAIPSQNYLAAPLQLAAMIETLQGDLFEPDPLVVTPGSP